MLSIERQFVRTHRPLYGHLVSLLETAIASGELPSGSRLPPERTLAERLSISRTTVVSAYRELEARGLLRGYVGRGTFVCAAPEPEGTPFAWRGKIAAAALRTSDSTLRDIVRHSSDARLLSLAAGEPAIDKFPNEAFLEAVNHVLRTDPSSAWRHGPTEGQPALREAIADRYGVPSDSVLILSGAQQGLDLLARCLIDPGDAVIIDRPGYLGAIQSFRAAGAKLTGWDILRGDTDELEDLLVRYRPKLIYTNPTFHNPTGTTLPVRVRREVLSLAQRYRVPIVEDATYRDLFFSEPPPPSLRELDDANIVIYLNSFSKVMAPGLRLGWIAAAPSIVDQIAIIKQRLDPHTPNLVQFAVARLMGQGAFDGHLATIRAEHAKRCTQMIAAIQRYVPAGALRFARPAGGLYLWCRLPTGVSASALYDRALAAGVAFVQGSAFYADPAGDSELRLCFSGVLPSAIDESIRKLAGCFGSSRVVLSA
ncbi:MAG TPA: PLP-dependent aminotransferase family protein [Vicinamibacterales bacterium]|jgi:2-aminoadipate transaminase|nr:PLP-dependent aminotransferase family protein [Vicinamibacterales bacterium]